MIEVSDLSCGYASPVLERVSFSLRPGEFLGIVGPNGTGKSTLLKTLYGLLKPLEGTISVFGKPFGQYRPLELARILAVMPQDPPDDADFLAEEVVAFGRHPYTTGMGWLSREDQRAIKEALGFVGIDLLGKRFMRELSGGQRQRVRFARALAQDPKVLLLDEPTTHMDLNRQLELLHLVQRLCERGVAAVAVLHDLNQAAQFCSRLLLLSGGALHADGTPAEVITEEHLADCFGVPVHVRYHPQTGAPYLLPRLTLNRGFGRGKIHVVGGGGSGRRVIPELHRMGYDLSIGVLNALDSDTELAASLGIPQILEAPFSPIGSENVELLRAQVRQAEAVVVPLVEFGDGNLRNLEALLEARRVFFLSPIEDHAGGRAMALFERLLKKGARIVSAEELFSILRKEHPTRELRLSAEACESPEGRDA